MRERKTGKMAFPSFPASFQTGLHSFSTGGTRLQAMLSSMPWASGPHAAVCASRAASASEAAEAVPTFSLSRNATVTVHSTLWELRVDQSR
jgi:hypothetical protein